MNTTNNTSKLVILGSYDRHSSADGVHSPPGYLNISKLAITFNVIPVAIAAITLGTGQAAQRIGAVFGMTSFLQCIGIGGSSAMGAMLFSINPFLAFVQRFVPRMLDGLLLGLHFPVCTPQNRCVHGESGNRILFRVFKYSFLL